MKHTPGPWRYRLNTQSFSVLADRTDGYSTICKLIVQQDKPSFTEQDKANAALIAAAPTLYTMLKRLLAEVRMDEKPSVALLTIEQAEEALAKAEGRV